MIRWITIVRKRVKNQDTTICSKVLPVSELETAETVIMKTYQHHEFKEEFRILIGQEKQILKEDIG